MSNEYMLYNLLHVGLGGGSVAAASCALKSSSVEINAFNVIAALGRMRTFAEGPSMLHFEGIRNHVARSGLCNFDGPWSDEDNRLKHLFKVQTKLLMTPNTHARNLIMCRFNTKLIIPRTWYYGLFSILGFYAYMIRWKRRQKKKRRMRRKVVVFKNSPSLPQMPFELLQGTRANKSK